MAAQADNPIAVYSALVANAIIAVTKFAAGAATGASSMISEGIHSLVDTGNQALILLGLRRARKPADAMHPFGYGKELYFWSFVVATLLFSLGGGFSIYEGVNHLRHPEPVTNPGWNYLVLGIALVVEAIAWVVAYRALRAKEPELPLLAAVRRSKNPAIFTVLAEDTAAVLGLLVAAAGVALSQWTGNGVYDGLASVVIGVILALVAVFLAYESKALLIGEGADPDTVASIRSLVAEDPDVEQVLDLLTLHFGPSQVLLNLGVRFRSGVSGAALPEVIERLEQKVRAAHPELTRVFIEAEGLAGVAPAAERPAQGAQGAGGAGGAGEGG